MLPLILTTKLQVPRLCTNFMARPRLTTQINNDLDQMLTLISAPAGFGKTMLLAEWASHHPHPVGWFSLDVNENQPFLFWLHFIGALQLITPGLDELMPPSFTDDSDLPLQPLLIALINEIARLPFPMTIALDNYHLIQNQEIHNSVAFLLENHPVNLHLVIASRSDPPLPLPRLRARGQVSEIRMEELRLSYAETTELLNGVHGYQLSPMQIATLHAATEGWIDGLRMAAICLHRLPPAQYQPVIAEFATNNRYVMEYLLAEIFQQQSHVRQQFLLHSSILDTLTGPLCRAVTGEAHAQQLLEELAEENLFITALDPAHDHYRYHTLFSDFLKHRLAQTQPEQVADLHRRASLWYEQQGLHSEAIQHAFAGCDLARALHLTEVTAELTTLRERFVAVQKYLEQRPDHFSSNGLEHQQIATILANNPIAQYDLNALALGRIYLELGHANEAVKLLLGINLADPAFNDPQAKFTLITALLEARLQQGKLQLAAATYQPFLALALAQPADPAWFRFYHHLFSLYYEWNHFDKAEWYVTQCLAPSTPFNGSQLWEGACFLSRARIGAAVGKSDASSAAMRQAETLAEKSNNRLLHAYIQAYQVRFWLQQGKIDTARAWVDACDLHLDESVAYRSLFEYLTLVRAYIACGKARQTLPFLEQQLLVAEGMGRGYDLIELLMLKALAHTVLGDQKQAFTEIANALCLAEPEGYVRLFVDEGPPILPLLKAAATRGVTLIYVQNLLAAFPSISSQTMNTERSIALTAPHLIANPLIEPLTERELAVLRLVATGHSNREVGELLTISSTTVKKHLGNVLGKLAAKNRTEAAAKARELRLV